MKPCSWFEVQSEYSIVWACSVAAAVSDFGPKARGEEKRDIDCSGFIAPGFAAFEKLTFVRLNGTVK